MSASVWAPGTAIDANNSIKQQAFVATAGQTIFNLTDFTYVNGTGSLYVFVAGGAQRPGVDFFERSTSQFELSTGAPEGAIVLALGFVEVSAILDTLLTYSPQYQVMTAGQTVVNFSTTYVPGVASLAIYYNGLRLAVNVDYTETSVSSITLTNPALVGDTVYSMIGQEIVSTDAVDASVVSYNPAGTGAVATNVKAKLDESVSVKDFGAVGDGVTDDTAAIQAAIDTGKYVVGQLGDIYKTTSALTFPAAAWQTLDLRGGTIKPIGSHDALTLEASQWLIKNVRFDSSLCTGTTIYAAAAIQEFTFEDLVIQSSAGNGITMIDPYNGRFNRVSVLNGAVRSVLLYSATLGTPVNSIWLDNCNFNGSTYIGEVVALEAVAGVFIKNCSFQNNEGAASSDLVIRGTANGGATGIVVDNCYFETGINKTGNSILIEGHASGSAIGVRVKNNYFQVSKQPVNVGSNVNSNLEISSNTFVSVTGASSYAVSATGSLRMNCHSNAGSQADLDRTFTPALQFGGAATGMTFSTQSGRYQRVGNRITGEIKLVFTAKGSSTGAAVVTGLPVAASASVEQNLGYSPIYFNMASISGGVFGRIGASSSGISLSTGAAANQSDLTEGNFTNTTNLYLTFAYEVA